MNISSIIANPLDVKTDLLCYIINSELNDILEFKSATHDITAVVERCMDDLDGRLGKVVTTTTQLEGTPRLLFAGSGSNITPDTLRDVAGTISKKARELGVKQFAIVCPNVQDPHNAVSQIVEGCMLALYSFDTYKAKKADPKPDLTIICRQDVEETVRIAKLTAEGVAFTRNIANQPPNQCPPAKLAEFADAISQNEKVKCTILSGSDLIDGGFGGINAVGQGSINTPRLIILEYNGGDGPPIALVGKAVTFDTGGISLKPGERMDEMKFDKCGGCTVLGTIKVISEMNLPINVVGLIPSVENMPGGGSYRPGDIIRLYGGKTAEILNTDAEGRLILADALAYAEERFSPRCIIDLATLTGACIIALGCDTAGMLSDNDDLASDIYESGIRTAENVWRLPLSSDYMDMIKSKVADIRNLVPGKAAGTIAAAAFLKSAVKETPWLHLDIAGTAWMQPPSKKRAYNGPGATGFGVRLLLDYLRADKSATY